MDRVSGIRIPLPMQISRSRLPPEQGSSSFGMTRSIDEKRRCGEYLARYLLGFAIAVF